MGNLKILMATAITAAMMSSAGYAADMAPVETPMAAPIEGTLYDWNGVYVGVSGGYLDPNMSVGFGGNNIEYGDSGYMIGGTIGYNYQMGNFVAGIEADLSAAEIDGKFDNLFGFGLEGNAEANYFATVRGRLGYAFDRFLVFGTAGAAFTDLNVSTPAGDIDENLTGYTVGGGVEYGITDNITTKLEYLYADFGDDETNLFPGDVKTELDMHVVRVGLNFKF